MQAGNHLEDLDPFESYMLQWRTRAEEILAGAQNEGDDNSLGAFNDHLRTLTSHFSPHRLDFSGEDEFSCIPDDELPATLFALHSQIYFHNPEEESYRGDTETEEILRAYFRLAADHSRDTSGRKVDYQKWQQDREAYGAKSAHIEALRAIAPNLQEEIFAEDLSIRIPASIKVSGERYLEWKHGLELSAEAERIFAWTQGKSIIIRSSALKSEDSQTSMSPGVFDSIVLDASHTTSDLTDAIIAVYKSTESQKAADHLREKRIFEAEVMGLEIQEFIPLTENRFKGHIDTIVPHQPALLGLFLNDSPTIPPIHRDEIKDGMIQGSYHLPQNSLHFPYDRKFGELNNSTLDAWWSLAQAGMLIEKAYGEPHQIEFIFEQGRDGKNILWLLQSRPLPAAASVPTDISFPEDALLLHSGRAVGAGDLILKVLSPLDDNRDKTGVVPVLRSHLINENNLTWFPKAGAVIVQEPIVEQHGHLPYLCLDRGLICIFPSNTLTDAMHGDLHYVYKVGPALDVRESELLQGYDTVRVVADGLEGRVYKEPENLRPRSDSQEQLEPKSRAEKQRGAAGWIQKVRDLFGI